MLSLPIAKALNNQIIHEAYASNYYLAMASWCDAQGFGGAAKFMFGHSDEERMHMLKLFHYINERGGQAIAPAVKQPPENFSSIKDMLESALQHEMEVTKHIHNVVDLCLGEKDYSTFTFLQWYVNEQHEEETLFRNVLDKVRLVDDEKNGLYLIDKELGELAGDEQDLSSEA